MSLLRRYFPEKFRRSTQTITIVGFICFLGCVVLFILFVTQPLPERLDAQDTRLVKYADGGVAHAFLSSDDRWRVGADLNKVDSRYTTALIRYEDKRFYHHPGVDPIAIARAVWLNVTFGARMSGASTLTMQLVRMLEPRPRTFRSKIIEAFRAMQIESRLSKVEILHAYMRFASFGRNIEGVSAASYLYFGHSPEILAPYEIATLLAVPQRPNQRYPSAKNRKALTDARNDIAEWLLETDSLDLGESEPVTSEVLLAQIKSTPVPTHIEPFARRIPHAANWLSKQTTSPVMETSIDAGMQRVDERVVKNYRTSANEHGIEHVSVVVVEHATGELRVLVGNHDFSDRPGSQIASFNVPRSPGSLLKPIVFAQAIDRGITLPNQLVADTPMSIDGYEPRNFDGKFNGVVQAEIALSDSLNIPFVRFVKDIGVDNFVGAVRDLGAQGISGDPGAYGLTSPVGGVIMRPLDVAQLYTSIANRGVYRELSTAPVEQPLDGIQTLTPQAWWLTHHAMTLRDEPGFSSRRFNPDRRRFAWKTGTSYGFRDAWTAGFGDRYTVVVWVGNLDNRGVSTLTGASRAAPIFFDVIRALDDEGLALTQPEGVSKIKVCSYSGHIPNEACEKTKEVWAMSKRFPSTPCPYHIHVDVDVRTGEAVGPSCRQGREWEKRTYLTWPPSVRRHLQDSHRFTTKVPKLAAECRPNHVTRPPKILSPPDRTIVLMPGIPATRQEVPLEAEAEYAGLELSWFVNGTFIGTASAEDRVWWTPSAGVHELMVMDAVGHVAKRNVTVR